jgi:UDP-N-acetyl-D-glucosamine dehydrogenase
MQQTRRDLIAIERDQSFNGVDRPIVCVQGLGFVGAAMAVAVANARQDDGRPYFDVIGIDLPTPSGRQRIEALNNGTFPFESGDETLERAVEVAAREGNFFATSDPKWYSSASTVIVDINCDVKVVEGEVQADTDTLIEAVRVVGARIPPNTLVLVETTVPPGACARIVAPILEDCLAERGLPKHAFLLAHSYERVMPGKDYYSSIVNFWRVYAGHTPAAADACEAFLRSVVNTTHFPLTRLQSTTASETAKVLENSYRATTIAFIEEWGRFAEAAGVDLFEVIDAIRMRPTHSNIRQPGLGVGGYCLTKDPLFGKFSADKLFGRPDLDFPFSTSAVKTNNLMPVGSVTKLQSMLHGSLAGKNILLVGVSYRPDVADTRFSPSATFLVEAEKLGASVTCYDPIVREWPETGRTIERDIPAAASFDAVVFAVSHHSYGKLDLPAWVGSGSPAILDANNVLTRHQRQTLRGLGCQVETIGRGPGL